MARNYDAVIQVRVSKTLATELDRIAKGEHRTVSQEVRMLIEQHVQNGRKR